jgi:hypothetical protein
MQTFSKNLEITSKFYTPEGWNESSFILSNRIIQGVIILDLLELANWSSHFVQPCLEAVQCTCKININVRGRDIIYSVLCNSENKMRWIFV